MGCGIVATHPGQMVTWLLWQACGDLASPACVCRGRFPPGHQPASDVAYCSALGNFTLERERNSSPCPAEPCCHSHPSQDTPLNLTAHCRGCWSATISLWRQACPLLTWHHGCHPALVRVLSPPLAVFLHQVPLAFSQPITQADKGAADAMESGLVPAQALQGHGMRGQPLQQVFAKPQRDLHFCLSVHPLGQLPAQRTLAWSTAGRWGQDSGSDSRVCPQPLAQPTHVGTRAQ